MTRLALVGFGRIAPRHLEVLRAQGAEIVAAANRSEAGRHAAEGAGIPRTYARIGEMLEHQRPDGVVCTASVAGIEAAAREILPFGLPTLLEKPPGTSLAGYDALCALAAEHHTPVFIGLNRRHYSVLRQALADAGGPEAVTAVWLDWSEDPGQLATRFPAEVVAQMIFGNSLHGLDLLTHLAGALPEPQLATQNHGAFRWLMSLQGVSARGVLASFHATWDAPARWRLTFFARGRRYTFAPLETCLVAEHGQSGERTIEPDDHDREFKAGFYEQARRFLVAVRARVVAPEDSLASARPAMVLAEALTRRFVDPGA